MNGIDVIKLYIDGLIRVGFNVLEDVKSAISNLWTEQLKVKKFEDDKPKQMAAEKNKELEAQNQKGNYIY